ncbi:MAG: UDP-N-acetylmuramoyl-L-alanyl-D-glutamate--2,6-diaminopimelate ligase, partial [Chthoniobacteraceae bacterium]|nr:UDP-N-acetylmuramoyl-L-alanyl-D-glutamate--2,6-diaminopimelate ligase [Chthoniobacteraceae bacterium]
EQGRDRNVEYDAAIFTNLTQDHLDYHHTMEAYFEAKLGLFTRMAEQPHKKGKAIVNIDDRWGQRLLQRLGRDVPQLPIVTYGMNARADFRAGALKSDISGTQYQLDAQGKTYLVRLPLIGAFNVYNSLAALAGAAALGVDLRTAVRALADAPSVPGRLQPVPVKRQFRVFVDYAHTDDALANVMKTLRDLNPRRLIVVFGCGGNRDKAKRPLMAEAVERGADWAIATSDNPRKESPEEILKEVEAGFRGKNYETIVDRREAIYRAISLAGPRDIVLIAGKGHETTQEFADMTVPFDDLAVARLAIEAKPVEMEP